MAMQPSIAAAYPTETWGALIASVTAVVGLVGILYKRLNDDIKDHDNKFEAGQKAFIEIGKELVSIGEKIKALEGEDNYESEELDRLDTDLRNLQKRLLIMETEYSHCCGDKKEGLHAIHK